MKQYLAIIAILITIGLSAQKIDSTISKEKIGYLTCEFQKSTQPGLPPTYTALISYQNDQYDYITDIGLIMLTDSSECDSMAKDIEACLPYMKLGKKNSITFERKQYSLAVYDFTLELLIEDTDHATMHINRKQAEALAKWLRSLQFP